MIKERRYEIEERVGRDTCTALFEPLVQSAKSNLPYDPSGQSCGINQPISLVKHTVQENDVTNEAKIIRLSVFIKR